MKMKIVLPYQRWLKYQATAMAKEEQKDLFYNKGKKYRLFIRSFLLSKNSWWFIILIVSLVYLLGCSLNFSFLNVINLTFDSATILIDSRIGNLATIASLTLVVIGFLIANLAIKDPFAYTMLFKYTWLFPIFYFILSTLGIMFLISMLRDEINQDLFNKFVLTGTYLSVFILFLIGILFKKIVKFTDKTYIGKLLRDEFIEEVTKNYQNKVKLHYTGVLLNKFFEDNKVKKHSIIDEINFNMDAKLLTEEKYDKIEKAKRQIIDINLRNLQKYIDKKSGKELKYSSELGIGRVTSNIDNYVWESNTEPAKGETKILEKSLKTKEVIFEDSVETNKLFQNYFNDKLEEYSMSSTHKDLEAILPTLEELCILQIKADNISTDIDCSNDISYRIFNAVRKSIENNHQETFNALSSFVSSIYRNAFDYNSINQFNTYIKFPADFYSIAVEKYDTTKGNSLPIALSLDKATSIYNALLSYRLGYDLRKESNLERKQEVIKFCYSVYNAFSHLFYCIIKNEDVESLTKTILLFNQTIDIDLGNSYKLQFKIDEIERLNEEDQDKPELEHLEQTIKIRKEYKSYGRHVLFGTKYWIYYLYSLDEISEESAINLIGQVGHIDSENTMEDILYLVENSRSYMGWDRWDYRKKVSGVMYFLTSAEKWLTFGFLVDQLITNTLFVNQEKLTSSQLNQAYNLFSSLNDYSKSIKINFKKWKRILKIETVKDLESRTKPILNVFASLKRQKIGIKEKQISEAQISPTKILKFKNLIGNAWKNKSCLNTLFQTVGNSELVNNEKEKLKIIGQSTFFEKAKMMFIDGDNYSTIYGVDQFGGNVGVWEDDTFLNKAIQNSSGLVVDEDLVSVIKKTISELKDNEVIPDLILVSSKNKFRRELRQSKLFKPAKEVTHDNDKTEPYFVGTFDNISVYFSYSRLLNDKIIACNFKESFSMKYKKNDDWFENELFVNVTRITEEEAIGKLAEDSEKWKSAEDNIELSDKDALVLIKTSVKLDFWTTKDFEILNNQSYRIGVINSKIN